MAGRARGAQELHRPRRASGLQHVLQQSAVLARQFLRLLRRILGIRDRFDLDPECAPDVGLAPTEASPMQAAQHGDLSAGGELARVLEPGHRADRGEPAFDARNE